MIKLSPSVRVERADLLNVITDEVIYEACNAGLVENPAEFDKEFKLMVFRNGSKSPARGGLFRVKKKGQPAYRKEIELVYGIKIALNDRYFDPEKYCKEEIEGYSYSHKYRQWRIAERSLRDKGVVYHPEYVSFDHHSVIGGIYTNNPEVAVKKVVVHEMAHCLIYWNHNQKYGRGMRKYPKSHGNEWKNLYAKLRKLLVNQHVEVV